AGLIIHEGQLTYAKSGFKKIVDLGEWWKNKTGLPLPLGGNVIRKDIPENVRHDLSEIMRASIDFGLTHRDEAVQHALPYAREINEKLATKFNGMYAYNDRIDISERRPLGLSRFPSHSLRR